jgi:tetratricopeptide (TPR) repeat protein
VLDLDDVALDAALRAALAADVVVIDERADTFAFRHALIGEVVASRLLPGERRRLHRRVADALAATPDLAATPTMAAGELAFHLEHAGDTHGAFDAALRASDELQRVAPAAALEQVERALALWDQVDAPADGRAAREWQAAELTYVTGDGPGAVALAISALARGTPPQGPAWGHERLARYLWTAGRLAESATEYERAAALLDADERSIAAAMVCSGLGEADLLFCRYESAQSWCERALGIVTGPEVDRATWVHANRVLGLVRSHLGDTDEAVMFCERAIAAARVPDNRAFATIYLAASLLDAGRLDDAVALALDGAAEGQRAGFDRSMGGYLSAIAVDGLTRLGRWSEARVLLERLAGIDAVPPTKFRLGVAAAALAIRHGDRERAHADIAGLEGLPIDPWHVIRLRAWHAEVALLSGEPAIAAEVADAVAATPCGADRRWPARLAQLSIAAPPARHPPHR